MIQRILLTAALCAGFTASTSLRALPPAAAGSASPSTVFNKMLTGEEKEVVDLAEAMPADKYSFVPTAGEFKGARSFGEQVKHIAEANYYFFSTWNLPGGKSEAEVGKITGKDAIVQLLRDSFAYAHAGIATITPENGFEEMGAAKTTRVGLAAGMLAHTMDHYGQLVEYARMNGIVPPASRKAGM